MSKISGDISPYQEYLSCFLPDSDKGGSWEHPELQKGGILVSRKPDISGRKSGHFQIVDTNLSIFGIKRLQYCLFEK